MIRHRRPVRSYVVRTGRTTDRQHRALEALSDRYCIPFSDNSLDLISLFSGKPVIVEIGFGNGKATADIAEQNREACYLGIEVYPAGVGNLLIELDERHLYNVRIIRHDAVAVFEKMLPAAGVSGIHLFFPDPWPKKRHAKRRIIQPTFVSLAISRLKCGGYVYAVTDWKEYAEWIYEAFTNEPALRNSAQKYCDRKVWRPVTRFERKAREKSHDIFELFFVKIST